MMNGWRIKLGTLLCGLALLAAGCEDDKNGVMIGGNSGIPPATVKPGPDMAPDLEVADMEPDASPTGAEYVPPDPGLLFDYLDDGLYEDLTMRESDVRASMGPHGTKRAFFNRRLAESLEERAVEHPVGAAALLELYDDDEQTLIGWAAMVKVAEFSDAGQGWYWYESLSVTDGSQPNVSGVGQVLCSNCHLAGEDLVLSPYPLE